MLRWCKLSACRSYVVIEFRGKNEYLCVSTYDGTTEEYMELWNSLEDQRDKIMSDYDIGVVRDGKIILTMNVIDMDLLEEVMTSEHMKAWDKKHNCVDVIYSLEEQS